MLGRQNWRTALVFGLCAALASITIAAAGQAIPPAGQLPGKIVYTRASDDPSAFAINIFVADGNGENERQISDTVDLAVYGSSRGEKMPRWSPDGQEIAFSTYNKDGLASIWVVRAEGGTPTPLVTNDGDGGDQTWQPTGDCLVYSGGHSGGTSTLDLKRACRAGTTTILLDTDDFDECEPDVSPDGSVIVYQSRRPPASDMDDPDWSLRLIDADGGNDRELYKPDQGSATSPRWSPDGARIAFVAGIPLGVGTLSVLDVASRTVARLADTAGGPIAWSPDGRQIMFYNASVDGPRLWERVAVDSAQSARESQLRGIYVFEDDGPSIVRLNGAAGGASAGSGSFRWGYMPDWWAPTLQATATEFSVTPTSTSTRTPTPHSSLTATGEHGSTVTPTSTSTRTPTPLVTDSPDQGARLYLPIGHRS